MESRSLNILKELLSDTRSTCNEPVFLTAQGNYVDKAGNFIHPYDLLVRIEKLRDTVSRGNDLAYLAIKEIEVTP